MKIVKIISEWKKIPKTQPVKQGYKRVEAIVEIGGMLYTRHLDVKK